MCLSCGCYEPHNSHGDIRHITYEGLSSAAAAAGITDSDAVNNIVATFSTGLSKGDHMQELSIAPDGLVTLRLSRPGEVIAKSSTSTTGTTTTPTGLTIPKGADAAYSVVKSLEPKKFTLGVAYAANSPDVAKARDGHIDFASPEELEECAWDYLRKGAQIGLFHQDGSQGHADVVESYIYRGPDWAVTGVGGDEYIVKAGDWMLGAKWDDYGWNLVKNGLAQGWSPQGRSKRRKPSEDALAQIDQRSTGA